MKLKRLAALAVAGVTATVGLSVVTVSPAFAARGSWTPYGKNNPINVGWKCGPTATVASSVYAQACVIRSTSVLNRVQAAVIVHNKRGTGYSANAEANLHENTAERYGIGDGSWTCSSSGLAQDSYSVCFGATQVYADGALADGYANGTYLDYSPPA